MYTHSGSFSQPSGTTQEINVTDITIENLLTQFQPQGYWEGFYFDQNANCYTSAFVFKEDGTYTSYNKGSPAGSGTYSVVQRMPAIFSTKFQISGPLVYQSILIETHGQFSMDNGPSPTWRTITYTYKPQGYVRNPFCP